MRAADVWRALQENWMLFALLGVVLAAGGAFYAYDASRGTAVSSAAEGGAEGAPAEEVGPRPAPARESGPAQALATIAQHQERYDADPGSSDAPALLSAMGNLYRQKLGDYRKAAQCYELLLHDHPEWEAKRTTYIQLISCYEQLEDRDSLRRVYREMMEAFPADSQEYQFAEEGLRH